VATDELGCEVISSRLTTALSYASFRSNLQFNGDASFSGTQVQVTPKSASKSGSAFYKTKLHVLDNFEANFKLRMTPYNGWTGDWAGDGMAFVIQSNPAASRAKGSKYGTRGLSNSLSIIFSGYNQGTAALKPFGAESSKYFVKVEVNGIERLDVKEEEKDLGIFPDEKRTGYDFGESERSVKIRHNYSTKMWTIYIGGKYLLRFKLDLRERGVTDANGMAYIGFAGSTLGDYYSKQVFYDFTLSRPVPVAAKATVEEDGRTVGMAGMPNEITIDARDDCGFAIYSDRAAFVVTIADQKTPNTPLPSSDVRLQPRLLNPGTYTVTFFPPAAGFYTVSVALPSASLPQGKVKIATVEVREF